MADPRTVKNPTPVVKTLPQLAEELGLHRSTLVRFEQRGIIPIAPIVGKPVQGRVYDAALEKKVKDAVDLYYKKKAIKRAEEGRPEAPKNFVVR